MLFDRRRGFQNPKFLALACDGGSFEVVPEARAEGGAEPGAHPDAGAEGQRGQLQQREGPAGGPRQLRQCPESTGSVTLGTLILMSMCARCKARFLGLVW